MEKTQCVSVSYSLLDPPRCLITYAIYIICSSPAKLSMLICLTSLQLISQFCHTSYYVHSQIYKSVPTCTDTSQTTNISTGSECNPDELTDPENGRVLFSTLTVGSTANYTCDIGFRLIGNSMRVCVNSGTLEWSGDEPTCERT